MDGRPAGIPFSDKGLSDPADGQIKAPRDKGLAGVPPRKRIRIPKGYNKYIQSIYSDEDYALRHLDCGLPPDSRVFMSGSRRLNEEPPAVYDRFGERLRSAYLDDDSEAWSPPDSPMEKE